MTQHLPTTDDRRPPCQSRDNPCSVHAVCGMWCARGVHAVCTRSAHFAQPNAAALRATSWPRHGNCQGRQPCSLAASQCGFQGVANLCRENPDEDGEDDGQAHARAGKHDCHEVANLLCLPSRKLALAVEGQHGNATCAIAVHCVCVCVYAPQCHSALSRARNPYTQSEGSQPGLEANLTYTTLCNSVAVALAMAA